MKKFLVLAVGLLLFGTGLVYSANDVTTTVSVTVQYLSVSISGTPAFGTVSPGDTYKLADTSATITNDGNCVAKWSLKTANSSGGWIPTVTGAAPASNTEFRLRAVFKSTAAVTGDFENSYDYLDTGYRESGTTDASPFFEYAAYGGQSVAVDANRAVWFSFCAPTTGGGNPSGTAQTITVYVQAAVQ